MDEAFLTKWDSAYLPESYGGADNFQGGRKVISVDYSDGGRQKTVVYDNAENKPTYCNKLLDCVYGLLRKERSE